MSLKSVILEECKIGSAKRGVGGTLSLWLGKNISLLLVPDTLTIPLLMLAGGQT